MSYSIELIFHWPHDRLALGWESMRATEDVPFNTFQLFLGIMTLRINTWEE